MIVKLLTEHHLELVSLKGGCRGSSESTHVKMPHCWKSHATAQFMLFSGVCKYTSSALSVANSAALRTIVPLICRSVKFLLCNFMHNGHLTILGQIIRQSFRIDNF